MKRNLFLVLLSALVLVFQPALLAQPSVGGGQVVGTYCALCGRVIPAGQTCPHMRGGGASGNPGADPRSQAIQQMGNGIKNGIERAFDDAINGPARARRNEALNLNNQGIQYFNNRQWELAENAFSAALGKSPGDPVIQQNLINARQALAQERQEALARKQAAEARKKQETHDRLASKLMLSGGSEGTRGSLTLNDMMMGDSDSDSRHVGVRGLPGIALNDNSGNGTDKPYGIPGLPGTYVNGPGSGSGIARPGDSKLQLMLGDDTAQPAAPANNTGTAPPNDSSVNGSEKPYGIPGLPGTYVNGPRAGPGLAKPDEAQLPLPLGDSDSGSGHVGVKGLPGIALNDNTGNGTDKPYGIPGLPGIYVNGPRSGPGMAQTAEPKAPAMPVDDTAPPRQPDNSATPPTPSPGTPGTPQPQQALPQAPAALRQQASTSQAAVTAPGPEEASTIARSGFDSALTPNNPTLVALNSDSHSSVAPRSAPAAASQPEFDFAKDMEKNSGLAIGRGQDLAATGAVRQGEYKLGWYSVEKSLGTNSEVAVNQAKLRDVMKLGRPIRDVSPLSDTSGYYLNAERDLLRSSGWTYHAGYWWPPKQ